MGEAGRQFSLSFDDTADLESSPNGDVKVVETQVLLFIRFSKLLPRGRRVWGVSWKGGENKKDLKRFMKVLKI